MAKKLRDTELKSTLDNYAKDLKSLATIKGGQFETPRIAEMIRSIPPRKWNAAQQIVNATILKKSAENDLKRLRATTMLKAAKGKAATGLSNAEDRKAFVDNDPKVQAAEIDLINAEAELLAAKLGYECLDDLFTAGKKIMDWLVDQDRSTRQYNRFADEGRKSGQHIPS